MLRELSIATDHDINTLIYPRILNTFTQQDGPRKLANLALLYKSIAEEKREDPQSCLFCEDSKEADDLRYILSDTPKEPTLPTPFCNPCIQMWADQNGGDPFTSPTTRNSTKKSSVMPYSIGRQNAISAILATQILINRKAVYGIVAMMFKKQLTETQLTLLVGMIGHTYVAPPLPSAPPGDTNYGATQVTTEVAPSAPPADPINAQQRLTLPFLRRGIMLPHSRTSRCTWYGSLGVCLVAINMLLTCTADGVAKFENTLLFGGFDDIDGHEPVIGLLFSMEVIGVACLLTAIMKCIKLSRNDSLQHQQPRRPDSRGPEQGRVIFEYKGRTYTSTPRA